MKLRLLLVSVALLSIGTIPAAVAQPRSLSTHTHLDQSKGVPELLETTESSSRIGYGSEDSHHTLPLSDSKTQLKPPISEMSPFSQQKWIDTGAVARDTQMHSDGFKAIQVPLSDSIPTQKDKDSQLLQPVKETSRLGEIEHPYTSAQWLVAESEPTSEGESAAVQVKSVRLNQTPNGLEVILETTSSQLLNVSPSSSGKTFVANIKNAQLTLPNGKAFRANKPVVGITAISVTQQGANSIRVTVIGTAGVPTGKLVQRDRTLVLGITPVAETPSEPIEVVSTAKPKKPESGYRVPDATTATKIPVPLRDIPQSIQVIPRRVIEERQVVRLNELSDNVSGVQPVPGYLGITRMLRHPIYAPQSP